MADGLKRAVKAKATRRKLKARPPIKLIATRRGLWIEGDDDAAVAYEWLEYPAHIQRAVNGSHGHWAPRAKRNSMQRASAKMHCNAYLQKRTKFPIVIKLIRVAPGTLDDDNLRVAFKATRDGVADWVGLDDRDPALVWDYGQERRGREWGVRVEIRRVS